jgi:hypothetical protein
MKRHQPPRPKWQPKPGHMLWYRQEVTIRSVEKECKATMAVFDDLPQKDRDRINDGEPARERTRWKPTR